MRVEPGAKKTHDSCKVIHRCGRVTTIYENPWHKQRQS